MNTNRFDELAALDRAHLVHPVAAWRQHEARGPLLLTGARGAWLTDAHGHELLDAFAGLWCVNVGYGQESVVQAATAQLRQLPYATGYFGFASEPAIRLAAKLAEITPASLTRAYLTLGGSEAVDAAVRFIVQYWNARGQPSKKHFIALERGYHGSSSTGAGLTALPVFHRGFDLPLATQHHIPSPNPYRHPQGNDAQALIAASVAALRAKVAELGADNVAAFFCEPIQGSGGVIVPPAGWLKAMRDAARELDILFVVDEVITGFGRTGPMFACDAEGVRARPDDAGQGPDLGLRADGRDHALGARSTRPLPTPRPPACRSATAPPIRRIRSAPRWRWRCCGSTRKAACSPTAQRVAPRFAAGLEALRAHPLVGDARHRGLLGALELVSDKATKRGFDPGSACPTVSSPPHGATASSSAASATRSLGFAPALTYTEADFDQLFARLTRRWTMCSLQPEVRPRRAGMRMSRYHADLREHRHD